EDGRVVLTDFGIAVASGTSTLTKTGELVGSIDYLAPERVKGGTPGPASDLWALGATLYQAVEGQPPFRKSTAVESAYAIAMDTPVDSVEGVPELPKQPTTEKPKPKPKPSPSRTKLPPTPEGYHRVQEKKFGISFPVPDGWKRKPMGLDEVDYIDPTGLVNLKM